MTAAPDPVPPVTRADVLATYKPVDAWWTVLVIDPLTARLLPRLVRYEAVTPNRLTLLAAGLGVASGGLFLRGQPVPAAVLFELRFVADCLDGKVARLTHTGSPEGAFLDKMTDVVVSTWVFSTAGCWLAERGELPKQLALLPAVAALLWGWSNGQLEGSTLRPMATALPPATRTTSSGAAPTAPAGAAPATGRSSVPGLGALTARLRASRLTRLPSSVEATTLALFLAPLTGSARLAAGGMWAVTGGFYLPAFVLNVTKVMRRAARP